VGQELSYEYCANGEKTGRRIVGERREKFYETRHEAFNARVFGSVWGDETEKSILIL
jgi:hypothetical protein